MVRDIQLADPEFQSPDAVDLLIGADYYGKIREEGLRQDPINAPTAQAKIFGWILFGPSEEFCKLPSELQNYHTSTDEELYELLQTFWKLDELPMKSNSSLSTEDQAYEDHFKATHSRDSEGRYVVKLPFRKLTEFHHMADTAPHRAPRESAGQYTLQQPPHLAIHEGLASLVQSKAN